jgi:8-oxo-dGTP pyrophosphatase MutT (NUDIX family)
MACFDLPPDTMVPVDDVVLSLDPDALPFEQAHADAIDAHWRIEKAAQPALFDGRLLMFSQMCLHERRLEGRCHLARYATLLYWRTIRPHPDVVHCFAHPALVSSDGALVAARMGAHTANPGKVYFAAGSFEGEDLRDGRIDLVANMEREVMEETGLDLKPLAHEPVFHALATTSGTVVFRRYRLSMTADEAARAIKAHVAADPQPEIEGPVILRSGRSVPHGLLPHMAAFRDWHFATPMAI